MIDKPILYSFRRCPYAMRARMALIASKIDVDHREIALRNKPAAMVALSPKATVPVLVLVNGSVIDESLDIMRWALHQSDPLGWGCAGDALINTNDGPFKYHLDRMKYAHRYEGANPAEHRSAAAAFLMPLEARLRKSPYLTGDTPRFADIAIFPFIRQFARVCLTAWQQEPLPRLHHWLDRFSNSDPFSAAMVKYPLWTAGDETSKESP